MCFWLYRPVTTCAELSGIPVIFTAVRSSMSRPVLLGANELGSKMVASRSGYVHTLRRPLAMRLAPSATVFNRPCMKELWLPSEPSGRLFWVGGAHGMKDLAFRTETGYSY